MFADLRQSVMLAQAVVLDLFDRKSKLPAFTRSISESLGTFGGRFFHPHKG